MVVVVMMRLFLHQQRVDIVGIDIGGIDIVGIDIVGIDIVLFLEMLSWRERGGKHLLQGLLGMMGSIHIMTHWL